MHDEVKVNESGNFFISSPSSRSFEDTYNTLRYADRAKHIRADVRFC